MRGGKEGEGLRERGEVVRVRGGGGRGGRAGLVGEGRQPRGGRGRMGEVLVALSPLWVSER